jgi:hypothetical protein
MDNTSLSAELKKDRSEELQLDKVEAIVKQFQEDVDKDMKVKDVKIITISNYYFNICQKSKLILKCLQGLRTVSRDLEKATKGVIHGIQRIHIDAESDEKGSPHFCLASKLLLPTIQSVSWFKIIYYFQSLESVRKRWISFKNKFSPLSSSLRRKCRPESISNTQSSLGRTSQGLFLPSEWLSSLSMAPSLQSKQ